MQKRIDRPAGPSQAGSSTAASSQNELTTASSHGQQEQVDEFLLPSILGKHCIVTVGDIVNFMGVLPVLVVSLFIKGGKYAAQCSVCVMEGEIVSSVLQDCSLCCSPLQLTESSFQVSHRMRSIIKKTKEVFTQQMCAGYMDNFRNLAFGNTFVQMQLAKAMRGFCKDVLTGKSLKRSFNLLSHPAYLQMFDLNLSNSFTKTFQIDTGYNELDNIMGAKWDVLSARSSETSVDHFFFIRSIKVKVTLSLVEFEIVKSKSTRPFQENYRQIAVSSLYTLENAETELTM